MSCKKLLVVAGAIALVASMTSAPALAQVNPNGWIQNRGWNLLAPLLNPYGCGGGGQAVLSQNWLPPHDLGLEDPKASDVWADIDFDASPATGFDLGGLVATPIWVSAAVLEASFSGAPYNMPAVPTNDTVDFQQLVDHLNNNVIDGDPATDGVQPREGLSVIPGDNVAGFGTTYVENMTGGPLPVEICFGSDDSGVLWVNNVQLNATSACRGVGNCSEVIPAILPPGVSKIAGAAMEGGGGWGMRVGIRNAATGALYTDFDSDVLVFLGTGPATGQAQYAVERDLVQPLNCDNFAPVPVSLVGAPGVGGDEDLLTVVEEITAADPTTLQVADVTNDGVVTDIEVPDDGIHQSTGAALEYYVLGPIANAAGAAPGFDLIRAGYLSIPDADVATLNEGDSVNDVDDVAQTVRRIAVNDGDALNYDNVGGDGDNILHYAWTKLTLTEATDVVIGAASDDSVQVLLDGVEVVIWNQGRGYGGFGQIGDDASCVISLAAGTHTIVTKTFEGGGGHGIRLIMLRIPTGDPDNVGPGGADCASATALAPGQIGIGCTVGGAVGTACDPQASPAHYYAVEGNGLTMTASTCLPMYLYDTYLAVFQGTCDDVGCIEANDDTCGRMSAVTWDSEVGQTYYIRVYGWDVRQGTYVLKLSDSDTPRSTLLPEPLIGSGVCADPDGDCDTEATAIVGQKITWTDVARSAVNDPGLGYSVVSDAASDTSVSISGEVVDEQQIADGGLFRSAVARFDNDSGPVGIFERSHDIGNPPVMGSTAFDGTTYAVVGSGQDIWNGGDDFHFAYSNVAGDFEAVIRVVAREPLNTTDGWGRQGIMGRWTCDRNSKYSMVLTTPVRSDGNAQDTPRYQIRRNHLEDGGNIHDRWWIHDGVFPTEGRFPSWMKLVRKGNALYGYQAENDGDAPDIWRMTGTDMSPVMPESLLVGIANQGRDDAAESPDGNEIQADNVSITPLDPPGDETGTAVDVLASLGFDDAEELGIIVVGAGGFTPAIVDGRLRLTDQTIASSATAAWWGIPAAEVALIEDGFLVEFDVYLAKDIPENPDDRNPADGMTFAVVSSGADDGLATMLQPFDPANGQLGVGAETLVGGGGGALAFAGGQIQNRDEVAQSLAVEFDIWEGGPDDVRHQTYASYYEPAGVGSPNFDGTYHVGLDVNGSINSIQTNLEMGVATDAMPDIFAPEGVHVKFLYLPSGAVRTYMQSNVEGSAELKVLDTYVDALPAGDLMIGFTGATGGATVTAEVDNVTLSSICAELTDSVAISGDASGEVNGANASLAATFTGADGAVAYSWTVADTAIAEVSGAADQDTVEIACLAEGTTDVTVSATDEACGNTVEDVIAVECVVLGVGLVPFDVNRDGQADMSDGISLLNHLFIAPKTMPCDGAYDAGGNRASLNWNGDAFVDLSDAVSCFSYLYLGGANHVLGSGCVLFEDCDIAEPGANQICTP